ncbi:MAG: DNA-directed RNA polymerase subunit M [Sulfolobales archaeon]|jgi:DNA-directed RNA polymerase subunit M|nr:DNA-directed RNA polymerase subunit M [Desulfurococcaceae archaeon]
MKFCPRCGALLLPKKEGSKEVLKCSKCGYEEVIKVKEGYTMTVSKPVAKDSKVKTTSIVSEGGRRFRSKEEYEQEKEEYYEIFLDLMREEEGSGEEGGE